MYRFHAQTRRIDWLFEQFATSAVGGAREFVKIVNRVYYKHSVHGYVMPFVDDIRHQYRLMINELRLAQRDDLTVVNVGGGSGFEYEQLLANRMRWKRYFFIEPDEEMLALFRSRHRPSDRDVRLCLGTFDQFIDQLKQYENKLIILHSCLHHIIWIEQFLDDVKRCMNVGDYLVLCHEPNNDYLWSPFMFLNYAVRSATTDILPRKLGIWKSSHARNDGQPWTNINDELLDLGAIARPLKPLAIRRIIDYGVGTKGDWKLLNIPRDADEGHWTPVDLAEYLGPSYETVYLNTYRILGYPGTSRLIERLNHNLERFFRFSGSVFCCVFERRS